MTTFPGAEAPARVRRVDSGGLGIAVHEWGEADAPPVLLAHGGYDFARTFDVFAPLIAAAGWRVVSWDHRGHGDSDRPALSSWDADVRDALAVLDSTTDRAVPVMGHSKGGGVILQLAEAVPHRVTRVVNIDGLPSEWPRPDVSDHERSRMMAAEMARWLDRRRKLGRGERKPGTIEELAARRARMNPRLSMDWLQYLVTVGAREDGDGWRWKLDPAMAFGGFGPWRPEWSLERLPGLGVPLLGMIATVQEEMGMGATEESVTPYLPPGARLHVFEDTGHFLHIERPNDVAALVVEFLAEGRQ